MGGSSSNPSSVILATDLRPDAFRLELLALPEGSASSSGASAGAGAAADELCFTLIVRDSAALDALRAAGHAALIVEEEAAVTPVRVHGHTATVSSIDARLLFLLLLSCIKHRSACLFALASSLPDRSAQGCPRHTCAYVCNVSRAAAGPHEHHPGRRRLHLAPPPVQHRQGAPPLPGLPFEGGRVAELVGVDRLTGCVAAAE